MSEVLLNQKIFPKIRILFWQKDRPWLVFMPEVTESQSTSQTTTSGGQNALWKLQKNKTIAQTNVFVQGCSSFRVQPVKIHESSANHLRATITILSLILHFWMTQIGTRQVGHQVYLSGWRAGKKWIWIPASCNRFNFVITPNHLHLWTINGSSRRYMKAIREINYILKK